MESEVRNQKISWNRDSSEIVHAPNLKNKIGAGSALILSLRNSGENPTRRAGSTARQERFNRERGKKRDEGVK